MTGLVNTILRGISKGPFDGIDSTFTRPERKCTEKGKIGFSLLSSKKSKDIANEFRKCSYLVGGSGYFL